jgi:hypothetical protein
MVFFSSIDINLCNLLDKQLKPFVPEKHKRSFLGTIDRFRVGSSPDDRSSQQMRTIAYLGILFQQNIKNYQEKNVYYLVIDNFHTTKW